MSEKTKRITFNIEVWGYGKDAREAFADVLDSISTWDAFDCPLPVSELEVTRCDECGGDDTGDANPCDCTELV